MKNIKANKTTNGFSFKLVVAVLIIAVIMLAPAVALAEEPADAVSDSSESVPVSGTTESASPTATTDNAVSLPASGSEPIGSETAATESSIDSTTPADIDSGSAISTEENITDASTAGIDNTATAQSETTGVTDVDSESNVPEYTVSDSSQSAESTPLEFEEPASPDNTDLESLGPEVTAILSESNISEDGDAPYAETTLDTTGETTEITDTTITPDPDEVAPGGTDAVPDASVEGNSYKADLTLDGLVEGTGGDQKLFTITFTELNPVDQTLGSTQLKLPDGFNPVNESLEVTSSVDSEVNGWNGKIEGMFIYLWALNEASLLVQNQFVSATFAASTPTESSSYTFETKAWTAANGEYDDIAADNNRTNNMHTDYSDPVVVLQYQQADGGEYSYSHDLVGGLEVDITAEGSGFDICVFTIAESVTSVIRLETPAEHIATATRYTPIGIDEWFSDTEEVIRPISVVNGYYVGWSDFYHIDYWPEGNSQIYSSLLGLMKDQPEFDSYELDGKSYVELKQIAHDEGLTYYITELEALSDQVWFAQIKLEPGATGVLTQNIKGAYGNTDYVFNNDDGDLWSAEGGYQGPEDGFGFVEGSSWISPYGPDIRWIDYYLNGQTGSMRSCPSILDFSGEYERIEKGVLYAGDYFIIEQHTSVTDGTIKRIINIGTPFTHGYYIEDMSFSGRSDIREYFQRSNVRPGDAVGCPCITECPVRPSSSTTVWAYAAIFNTNSPMPGSSRQVFINQLLPALQSIIHSGFVTNGTQGQLIAAKLAYNRVLQMYQTLGGSLSPTEKAFVESGLAVAWAAIQALEVSLQARAGEPVDLGILIEVYNQAQLILAENRELLSTEQIAYSIAILTEIGALISALSP